MKGSTGDILILNIFQIAPVVCQTLFFDASNNTKIGRRKTGDSYLHNNPNTNLDGFIRVPS